MTGPRLSIIPARAATDRSLKPRDLQVLCVLGRHTDDLGWCRRSQVKMADEMGCARSTVFEAIERLVKSGYLERHEKHEESGRDSAHYYRVILDPVHPHVEAVNEAEDPCRLVGTPADIPAPPAGPEPAPPAGPGPAPINDPYLTTPPNVERERGQEDRKEGEKPEGLTKRAEALFYRAFKHWKRFDVSPKPPMLAAWAKLTWADMEACAPCVPVFLEQCRKDGVKQPCAIATFIDTRMWVPFLDRARSSIEPVRPEIAPAFGPLWSQLAFEALFAGPVDPGPSEITREKRAATYAATREMLGPEKAAAMYRRMGHDIASDGALIFPDDFEARVEREHLAAKGWPAVNALFQAAREGRASPIPNGFRARTDLFEPVPVTLGLMAAWRTEFERRGWPPIPDPGKQPVIFFPAGGPERLMEFKMAVRGGHDDGTRQAAE